MTRSPLPCQREREHVLHFQKYWEIPSAPHQQPLRVSQRSSTPAWLIDLWFLRANADMAAVRGAEQAEPLEVVSQKSSTRAPASLFKVNNHGSYSHYWIRIKHLSQLLGDLCVHESPRCSILKLDVASPLWVIKLSILGTAFWKTRKGTGKKTKC